MKTPVDVTEKKDEKDSVEAKRPRQLKPAWSSSKLLSRVLTDLGEKIVSGHYMPGNSIPREQALMDEHNVSRSVVREAVRILSEKGLLRSRTRAGTIVLYPWEWNLMDDDILTWIFRHDVSAQLLESLHESRLLIEPAAASYAAARATAKDLVVLEEALNAMYENSPFDEKTREAHVNADWSFHYGIILASKNLIFAQFVGVIRNILIESFRSTYSNSESNERGLAKHRIVYEAIRARDPNLARETMSDIVRDAQERFLRRTD